MNHLKSEKNEETSICIVTSPRPGAGVVPLSNLVDILRCSSSRLYIITGNEAGAVLRNRKDIQGRSINNEVPKELLPMILNYALLQLKISYYVMEAIKKANIFIFFEGECLLLPLLTARAFGKTVVLNLAASMPNILDAEGGASLKSKLLKFMEKLNYRLSYKIVLFSSRLIDDWHLNSYVSKIYIARHHFIDLEVFRNFKSTSERECMVGFFGRLEAEKGAINFVESIPEVMKDVDNINVDSIKFLVGGSGSESDKIRGLIEGNGLEDKVTMPGWIPHQELPKYLNELKLLVMPSYTEGLPGIMLEAMACGTVVLATPVGAIPEFIKDAETGFILTDNSPECISRTIVRALQFPDLEKIARNARSIIEREMTYEVASHQWRNVIRVLHEDLRRC
jgi:glycosyltransferase involved in cell wall biosynthesis